MNSPSATFTQIRASKRCRMRNLNKLHVGQETFVGDNVPDGFYSAIKTLKTKDKISLKKSPYYDGFVKDYRNILELSKNSEPIPPITELQSTEILHKLKPGVSDFFNITPNHYLYAGPAGCRHFHLLLSSLINDVNATSINEVNSVYSCVLFKGHNKDKSSSKSYRTISTCPLVAKGLDLYIRDLYITYSFVYLPGNSN